MEKNAEINFSLVFLISLFIHIIFTLVLFFPVYNEYLWNKSLSDDSAAGRDIIVNINQDKKKVESRKTLLSDKDSAAKGFITKEKGDNWLNNYRDFAILRGSQGVSKYARKSMKMRDKTGILITDNSNLIVSLMKEEMGNMLGERGVSEFTRIPDRNSFTRQNSIFYSNDGTFSFNTKKFKPFKYFKKMKDKIASNWYPPLLANAVIYGYNPLTGSYTPGRLRIMAIPNQMVKLYFTMNRNGDILDVAIVDSMSNHYLDSSCLDAVNNSKNFGKVPKELKGDVIVIRFVFLYYAR